ncbi:MAG: thioredoxin family protein [Verrucomicrobiota bacterium]|jgi:hypothetical protein
MVFRRIRSTVRTWSLLLLLTAALPGPRVQAAELDWETSREAALDRAAAEGKRVLLLAGRNSCAFCQHVKTVVCEDPAVRGVLDQYYVPWYSLIDDSTEWHPYALGLIQFNLPLIAIVDPDRPQQFLQRSTGDRQEAEFLEFVQAWAKPKPPKLFLQSESGGQLFLRWTTDPAMRYRVEVSTDHGDSWQALSDDLLGAAQPEYLFPIEPAAHARFRVMTAHAEADAE